MTPTEQHALAAYIAERILEATPHRELVQPEDDGLYVDGWKLPSGRFVAGRQVTGDLDLLVNDVVPKVVQRLGGGAAFTLELNDGSMWAGFYNPKLGVGDDRDWLWSGKGQHAATAICIAARAAWEATS